MKPTKKAKTSKSNAGRTAPKLIRIGPGHPFTINEIARRSSINLSFVSRIFRGESCPSMATAAKLATVFGVSVGSIFQYLHDHCQQPR